MHVLVCSRSKHGAGEMGQLKKFFRGLFSDTSDFLLRNCEARYAEQVDAVEVSKLEGPTNQAAAEGSAMALGVGATVEARDCLGAAPRLNLTGSR
jgi:hypothetical protein